MNVLAIDTATELLALSAQSGEAWASFCMRRGLQHSPALLPQAEKLLAELGLAAGDLELIVCSLGPGSFTGIRIGLATAMGIGQARGIPVVGVSTLDALARPWDCRDGDVFPVIDARKGRIYTALYRSGAREGDYRDISPEDLGALLAGARTPLLVGPDAPRIRALLPPASKDVPAVDFLDPRALLRLGVEAYRTRGADEGVLQPLYLRKSEAELMSGKKECRQERPTRMSPGATEGMSDRENKEKMEAAHGSDEPLELVEAADGADEPLELEDVEQLDQQALVETDRHDLEEFGVWKSCHLNEAIPSLYLDRSLRILQANGSFCSMFGCDPPVSGVYFTQFFAPSFNEAKSAELFRAVLSPATGYAWHGKVEKIGMDQLLIVSKVWVMPIGGQSGSPPRAYSAVCLDMTDEHRQLLQSTFTSLLGAARLKDNDTGNHIERVNRYARVLAQDLLEQGAPGVDREFVESIGLVAALHDVGKIGTPDDILNKAGQLEAWEWDVMKQHTTNGAYILSTYPNPMAREIALRHHERWDGTGYPHGLSEDLIPLSARIVAVADVYDALRMRRNYKEPYTHEQTVKNMMAERGTHFDPYLLDRFVQISDRLQRDIQRAGGRPVGPPEGEMPPAPPGAAGECRQERRGWNQLLERRKVLGRSGRCSAVLLLDGRVDLPAVNLDLRRRLDPQLDLVALDVDHGDLDLVADHDALADAAGEDQHEAPCLAAASSSWMTCRMPQRGLVLMDCRPTWVVRLKTRGP